MNAIHATLTLLILLFHLPPVRGEVGVKEIDAADFERLHAAIKPQPGESPWRDIPWLTNVTKARQKAIAEDKPIVILTAADGSPLSRT